MTALSHRSQCSLSHPGEASGARAAWEVCGASARAGRKELVLREGAVRKDKPILQGTRWSQAILPLKNQTGMGNMPKGTPVV